MAAQAHSAGAVLISCVWCTQQQDPVLLQICTPCRFASSQGTLGPLCRVCCEKVHSNADACAGARSLFLASGCGSCDGTAGVEYCQECTKVFCSICGPALHDTGNPAYQGHTRVQLAELSLAGGGAKADFLAGLESYAEQLVRPPPPQGLGFEHFRIQQRAGYRQEDPLNKAFEVLCLCCQKVYSSGGTPKPAIHATASLANFKAHIGTPGQQKRQQQCQHCAAAAAPVPLASNIGTLRDASADDEGSAAGSEDTTMEVAPAAPTHVRRTDAEEQQWLGLEAYVADLDRHLVVDREGRQVRCPSCIRDRACGFDGFCLALPALMDECLDAKQRCKEHVRSERHQQHVASGLRQAQLPFKAAAADDTGLAVSRERGLRQLCFGWYRQKHFYASKEYSVQPLKDSGLAGAEWYIDPVEEPAPAFLLQYMQETDAAGASNDDLVSEADPIYVASDEDVDGDDTQGKMLLLRGTVRHRKCLRIQTDANAAFGHGMCGYCASIPKLDDFRRRMIRQAGQATHGSHKNMRYMGRPELVDRARKLREDNRELRYQLFRQSTVICRKSVQVLGLRQRLEAAAGRGDMRKIVDDLNRAYDRGRLGADQAVLMNFIRDLARNMNAAGASGNRWSPSTHALYQVLLFWAGPRVTSLLQLNIGGPTVETVRKGLRTGYVYTGSLNPEAFKRLGAVYKRLKEAKGIIGPVPTQMSEDETKIDSSVTFDLASNTLVGFCGDEGDGHTCSLDGVRVDLPPGPDGDGYDVIVQAFAGKKRGGYGRVMVINPLHSQLPKLCVMVQAVCNRFDADFVRSQWTHAAELWRTHLLHALGPLIGHASDGDARRRKLQLEDYRAQGSGERGSRYYLPAPGFLFSAWQQGGEVRGIHSQDPIHNGKKLMNPLDSATRVLAMGDYMAHMSHVKAVFDQLPFAQHGLRANDVERTDRQNWAACQRLAFRRVRAGLATLASRHGTPTHGTSAYLEVIWNYVSVFFSSSWTLAERAEAASFVLHFLRLWRSWLLRAERLTLKANFISRECYEDITISVHNVILIIRFFRDFTPGLPCALMQDGSDCCEKVFSELCGSGASSTMQRIYTHHDALRAVPKYWHVEEQMCNPDAPLKKRSHEKLCDVWHKDAMPGNDNGADGHPAAADLTVYPSDAELTLQWTLGQQRATTFAWSLGIRPPSLKHLLSPPAGFPTALPSTFAEADQWYIEPWAEEETALLHMRTADHDDQGHEAPMNTIPAVPNRPAGAQAPIRSAALPEAGRGQPATAARDDAPSLRSESDTDDDDGDETDHPHTLGAKALAAIQPSDEELSDHPGLATHTFDVVEDDLGVEQEVIVGGISRDSDNARSELRAVVDTLITEAISDAPTEGEPAMVTIECEGGPGPSSSRTKICPHVEVPERGLVSIQQLVSELNHVKPGAKLSKDRLTRVTQGTSGAPSQRTVFQALERERRMLGLQGDFAMIFENSSENRNSQQPYHFWLGKVQRLIKLAGRRRVEYREPVDLDSYEGTIVVVAHWYKATQADTSGPDVDSVYVLNEPDHQCYDIAHVLAPITLTSKAVQGADGSESFEYVLSKIDRDALDAAIAEIAQSELPRGDASGTRAKRKRSQMMADDGRETRTTTSTRDRVITAVQYHT